MQKARPAISEKLTVKTIKPCCDCSKIPDIHLNFSGNTWRKAVVFKEPMVDLNKTSMKLKLLLVVACLAFNFKASAQLKFGVELNAYASKLTNISPDTIVSYGLSGAKVNHSPSYGLAPALVLRKDIGKKFSLETGLGYWREKHNIHLKFYSQFFRHEFDTTLNISLSYIQIPLLLTYKIPMNEATSFMLSGGIKSKILIHQKDNYQNIIYEEIGFSTDFSAYKRIVLAPSVAIALNKQIKANKSFEVGLFGTMNATPFVSSRWGFYNNLYPSKNLQTGLTFKYFL